MNITREEESLSIANINILVRFNKTREIFFSVIRIFSIFLTTAATNTSVERVRCSMPDALYSNNPANV